MIRRFVRLVLLSAWIGILAVGTATGQANVPQTIRYATIVSVERTIVEVDSSSSGAQVGATVGAVAGYALADRSDRWLGGLLGGALGGAAGRAADKRAKKKKGWQLIVRLENTGEEIGVQVPGKKQEHQVGDRIRLLTSAGGKTQVSAVTEAPTGS
jgi:outer membrane lipoprotein SlyB